MFKKKKIIALIPARSGSKGLPGKNIRLLLGKPLLAWSIEQALASNYIDKVVVSTDSITIAAIAKKHGAEVPFLRPARLATDTAQTMDVVLQALQYFSEKQERFDYLVLLEPTSPLRETADIDKCIKKLAENRVGGISLVSIAETGIIHPDFNVKISPRGLLFPYAGDFKPAVRRQEVTRVYYLQGNIYISEISGVYRYGGFLHAKTLGYIVPKSKSIEVDDIYDFLCVEALLKARLKRT